ncbi:MAG: glycoside hydrolase family 2 protein [Spirochaetota bacterium]
MPQIPRPEHPTPQFERSSWISLNGQWTCQFNRIPRGFSGDLELPTRREQAPANPGPYQHAITVPFAPESPLSGIGYEDFIDSMDYHRVVEVPQAWEGKRVLLHFGGVDFHADVYVNGAWVGSHSGGSSPFTLDITRFAPAGSAANLVIAVRDYINSGDQPGGKQTHYAQSYGCFYTRTTGIWQTVWIEAVDPAGLSSVQIIPSAAAGTFTVVPRYLRHDANAELELIVSREGKEVGRASSPCRDGHPLTATVREPVLWYPGAPALYDIRLVVKKGASELDVVSSYGALRDVTIRDGKFYINEKSVYLRLVLDQGFYPDGIWTAPSDDSLKRDIELSMAAGFNGARLHQKVFESRFHYWADRLGYLTWSEWASWGFDFNNYAAARAFENEIREVVMHLRNHPSIVAWTPFNETGSYRNPRSHHLNHIDATAICRQLDPTRPVNDTSGYIHHDTDIYTVHTYAATGEKLREQLSPGEDGQPFRNHPAADAPHEGQPYVVDEFGGIKWVGELPEGDGNEEREDDTKAWGYGGTPRTKDAFFERLTGLVDTLLSFDHVAGWCYTQLTDVEQEQNGVYFYDRSEKFDSARWYEQFSRKPRGYDL